ncbi:MAG: NusG domain II-containing protein [Clostridia bacterium]|nr:NusG domain II-containing protein [Clostridia bacterium]
MKNKKLMILLATALFLLTGCGQTEPVAPAETKAAETVAEEPAAESVTEAPAAETTVQEPAMELPAEQTTEQPFLVQVTDDDPSIAYVLVRMPEAIGLLPLPVEGEYTRTIRQVMADGTEAVNVLHLTANGVWMEDSNCEGHDCILEGEVTLENREERVLWNMIICLPHQLSLELITREEAVQLTGR